MRWYQLARWAWWWRQGVPPWRAHRYLRRNERAIARWLEEEAR